MSGDYRDFYRGRKVLVTGGLGFIGSNLCRSLADLGAKVLVAAAARHVAALFQRADGLADGLLGHAQRPGDLGGCGAPVGHRSQDGVVGGRDGIPRIVPGQAGEEGLLLDRREL